MKPKRSRRAEVQKKQISPKSAAPPQPSAEETKQIPAASNSAVPNNPPPDPKPAPQVPAEIISVITEQDWERVFHCGNSPSAVLN